jgi:hypothetical protein
MVAGSLLFAAARRSSLQLLLLTGTIAVGASYLAMAGAGSLLVACLAAAIGGAGNGVQWVAVISTIQGLTATEYQARVLGLLESIGAALPGLGFVLGGAAAALLNPRASFVVAGAGVLVVVAVAAPLLRGTNWSSASLFEARAATEHPGEVEIARAPTPIPGA